MLENAYNAVAVKLLLFCAVIVWETVYRSFSFVPFYQQLAEHCKDKSLN